MFCDELGRLHAAKIVSLLVLIAGFFKIFIPYRVSTLFFFFSFFYFFNCLILSMIHNLVKKFLENFYFLWRCNSSLKLYTATDFNNSFSLEAGIC